MKLLHAFALIPRMCKLFFVLVLLWGSASAVEEAQKASEISSPKRPTVELYRCEDSKFETDLIMNVPSYPFFQMIDIRIRKEPFPGCKFGEFSSSANFTSFADIADGYESLLDHPVEIWTELLAEDIFAYDSIKGIMQQTIEGKGVSISPQGFLNVEDHNYDLDEFCVKNFSQVEFNGKLYNHSLLEISYCSYNCSNPKSLCIPKCCPLGQSIFYMGEGVGCYPAGGEVWKGFFYNKYGKRINLEEEKKKDRRYHYHREIINCDVKLKPNEKNATVEHWYMKNFKKGNVSEPKTLFRLSEEGKLKFLGASRGYEQLKDGVQYCIDGLIEDLSLGYTGSEDYQVALVCSVDNEKCYETDDKTKKHVISAVYMACLFTAAGFYLATTAVYLLLWDSQKVHGWTVVSLMASLFFMCSSTAMAHMLGLFGGTGLRNSIGCKANAIVAHYFYISSFTWLCIVNYDIWSTFRALQRRHEKDFSKLWWYSAVGWGIPLVFICISITLNELYPERESMVVIPEYGDSLCFVASWAQGPYIYYPLIFPIVVILALTLSTFWNLFGFQRDAAMARSSSSKSDRKLAKLYLKLSLILGTSWSFEVISWMASSENCQHWIWMVADLYNALSAILIFIFFGCKNSNLVSLEEKFPVFKKLGLCRSCRESYTPGESSGSSGTKSTGLASKEKGSSSAVVDESNSTPMTSYNTAGIHNRGHESTRKSTK